MKKQNLSYVLMAGCLVLLAGFLSYWLYTAYQKEKAQLKVEVERLILDSKRTVQDSLLQKILQPYSEQIKSMSLVDTLDGFNLNFTKHFHDKHPEMNMDINIISKMSQSFGEIEDSVWHHSSQPFDTSGLAAISIIMSDNFADLPFPQSSTSFYGNQRVNKIMLQNISQNLRAAPLPQNFKLVTQAERDTSGRFLSLAIFKAEVEEKRFLQFGQTSPYLFKKIIPQILFSLFLFSLTGLAFYTVHHNLQEQKRLMALKSNFISNMTHELKTPIATIGVAIEAMQDFGALKDPAKTKEYLQFSKTELNRLSLLVEKVLNMASFENGSYALRREPIALATLIEKVIASMQLQLSKLAATLHFDYDEQETFLIYGDPVHWSNVLHNLLDNSLKYSQAPAQINIRLYREGKQLKLLFEDQGMGIPQAYQNRVFDRFFRVPTGNVHRVKGHGLGLSYVAEIIHQHQGQIQLSSEEGIGTSFEISVPQYKEKR